jgi:carboxyl-terminal processing protease
MEEEKRQKVYKIILLVVLTVFITFICTSLVMYKMGYVNGDIKYVMMPGSNSGLSIDLLRMRETIDKYFLGEIDEEKLREGAIKGYVEGLGDEYTEYMTKEEMESFYEQALGTFDGIGIYMTKNTDTNAVTVIAPIKDSPAFKAGILPGDVITKVDGVSCIGEETTEVSKKIKGQVGTTVKIEVLRNSETLTFDIIREHIKIHFVEGKVLTNNVGYIEIASFDEDEVNMYHYDTGVDTKLPDNSQLKWTSDDTVSIDIGDDIVTVSLD